MPDTQHDFTSSYEGNGESWNFHGAQEYFEVETAERQKYWIIRKPKFWLWVERKLEL